MGSPHKVNHRRPFHGLSRSAIQVSSFLEMAGKLKERLGPLLFQLAPTFKKDVPRLCAFLALLPFERRVAFEFRHPSWFDDEVLGLLCDHRAALCIAGHIAPQPVTSCWASAFALEKSPNTMGGGSPRHILKMDVRP